MLDRNPAWCCCPCLPSFPLVNPLQSVFSLLYSENCLVMVSIGPVAAKFNGHLSIIATNFSWNSKYLPNSIWNACLSLCGGYFITFYLYLHYLLLPSWLLFSTLDPFTLRFSSKILSLLMSHTPSWRTHLFLEYQVPCIYDPWLFIFSTDHFLEFQICISSLLPDIFSRYITNTLNLTYPILNPLYVLPNYAPLHLILMFKSEASRSLPLCYALIQSVIRSESMDIYGIQSMTTVPVLLQTLIISNLSCCSSLWPDLSTCRRSHLPFLLNLYSTIVSLGI